LFGPKNRTSQCANDSVIVKKNRQYSTAWKLVFSKGTMLSMPDKCE